MTPDERDRWRIDQLEESQRMLAPLTTQVAILSHRLEDLREDVQGLNEKLDEGFEDLHTEKQARQKSRVYVAGAVIAGSSAILAALVTALLGAH